VTGARTVGPDGILAGLLERRPELEPVTGQVQAAFELLRDSFAGGHKLLACGNGGSAADAGHIVGELMKGMSRRRPLPQREAAAFDVLASGEQRDYLLAHLEQALPSIDLGSHQALLSAIGNDTAGDMGFAQQVVGYGRPGDVLWGLSTSGRSRNVNLAAATARARGLSVLAFTGHAPSTLSELADVAVRVPAIATPHVQEFHISIYHALCEMLETFFFARIDATGLSTNNVNKGKGFTDENLPYHEPQTGHDWPDRSRSGRCPRRVGLQRVFRQQQRRETNPGHHRAVQRADLQHPG
jgi:D-sedoheptulose 7-phosphate isomerase